MQIPTTELLTNPTVDWTSVAVAALIFVLLLTVLVYRLLSDRIQKGLREEIVAVASRIKESQVQIQASITHLALEFRTELKDHNNRITRMEIVHERWGNGRVIDDHITQLSRRADEHDLGLVKLKSDLSEVNKTMHAIEMKLTNNFSEVKQLITEVGTRVGVWERMMKDDDEEN